MPKVETFLTLAQIEQIENIRNDQSRSNWIKEAVELKLGIDVAKYEFDVDGLIELLRQYPYSYISAKILLNMTEITPGVVRLP